VVSRRRARGYTMMEIVVVMALFGVFLFILVTLTTEMRRNEKKWPINFFSHPEVGYALARMRHDVLDSTAFPDSIDKYSQSPTTLILYTINQDGTAETVVWDFNKPGEVHRVAFKATLLSSEWKTLEDPIFISSFEPVGSGDEQQVHIRAIDKQGKIAIDQIFVPRPHS
jgi:prepilin-type N-terminal cleavage/methylation domain-containing protein